ncbi:hypothetical protein PGTUg99_015927 [Puccinia graminis f. sp. tritici]|uniref:Uncharacterized protein n=1 Tax=Puccinia graminis f. sp. tritici TaxID=56615 RepID=A0A5B0QRV3_PUCGR|nr:hypothetical protein PGTUg99_015927 [Puccinia graminis f. sp. tritici]
MPLVIAHDCAVRREANYVHHHHLRKTTPKSSFVRWLSIAPFSDAISINPTILKLHHG